MKRLPKGRGTALLAVCLVVLLGSLAAAAVAAATTALLPARVEEVARAVEKVRGRRFERAVPASEIDGTELKKVLRAKVFEGFPTSPENTIATLVSLGFFEETPNLIDKLIDFYASQVIAFYDPEPRRFFLVKGAGDHLPDGGAGELGGAMAEKMIFAHELTHALQDETLRLDRRIKDLKDNGDRALALESLLEGEATLVMGSPRRRIRITIHASSSAESCSWQRLRRIAASARTPGRSSTAWSSLPE